MLKEKITDDDGQQLLRVLETNVQRGASLMKQVLAYGRGVTGERAMTVAAMQGRAAFFAPDTRMRPHRGCPPWITSRSIETPALQRSPTLQAPVERPIQAGPMQRLAALTRCHGGAPASKRGRAQWLGLNGTE